MAGCGSHGGAGHSADGRVSLVLLPVATRGQEGAMRRTWRIRRSTVEQPDGQDRWDRAYQLLLRWATEVPREGEDDASSVLRPGVDGAAAAGADDRPAGHATAQLRGRPRRVG